MNTTTTTNPPTTYTLTASTLGHEIRVEFAPEVSNPTRVVITYTADRYFGGFALRVNRMPLDGSYWSLSQGYSMWSRTSARRIWNDLLTAGFEVTQ